MWGKLYRLTIGCREQNPHLQPEGGLGPDFDKICCALKTKITNPQKILTACAAITWDSRLPLTACLFRKDRAGSPLYRGPHKARYRLIGQSLGRRSATDGSPTISQNLCNRAKRKTKTRSEYKGLEWDNVPRKWKARTQLDGRKIYLGSFESEEAAARAYDTAAKKYHGQFATPNFPT